MAWMISLLVGTSVLMSKSVAASCMFGTTVGGCLFKSSLECSVQRRCCPPSDVNKISLFLAHLVQLPPPHGMQGSLCTSIYLLLFGVSPLCSLPDTSLDVFL